jgi:predicted dehydrogenase
VAACDLYAGRLVRVREVFGNDIKTMVDYREMLAMKEVDAVCISTTDHWHDWMTIAALEAGKAVYCEKPMVHRLEEGKAVIEAEKKTGGVLQIGSQRTSSLLVEKARELLFSGAIGELNLVEISADRASANGAWQYSIPTDAEAGTVDWDRFIGDAPKVSYDPVRFFRWRNYRDYGTGIAGDLFVHNFSFLHAVTGSIGPSRIYATGGLRFWKDGRDVPDITLGLYDYDARGKMPAYNVQLRVSFVDGSGSPEVTRFIGSEGVMSVGGGAIVLKKSKVKVEPSYGGWDSFQTFSEAQQKEFERWFKGKYPEGPATMIEPNEFNWSLPRGYSGHVEHWKNFAESVRNGKAVFQDGEFGLRAAGPALATNDSYFGKKVVNWDPEKMEVG